MNINKQKILIIGGGGREHAIGWKINQSKNCGDIYFAPGNAGTAKIGTNVDIKATEIEKLLTFAKNENIDITLAVPDDPLSMGIVDLFEENNLRIWGPNKKAAKLESSKAYSKDFMKRYDLPTASFEVFTDFEKAKEYVDKQSLPVVVKASGLALGKGVIIAQTYDEAHNALKEMLVDKKFGEAGNEVVIEEYMTGPEISIHVFSDGESYKIFPSAQDHKKIGEGNIGLNTGGMGTVSPVGIVTDSLMNEIEENIVKPTLEAIKKEGAPFVGILYPGLILTKSGPKILEYNARFGDPETQTYMRLLNTDLLEIINATLEKKLDTLEIDWSTGSACNIVLASGGYPEAYEKGKIISGIDEAEIDQDVVVFHAGTKINEENNLVTSGGRVLGVSTVGSDLDEALERAYKAIEKISFEDMQYRKDIGKAFN